MTRLWLFGCPLAHNLWINVSCTSGIMLSLRSDVAREKSAIEIVSAFVRGPPQLIRPTEKMIQPSIE